MKKFITYSFFGLLLLLLIGAIWVYNANYFERDGQVEISINEKPIKIIRDENGIAYVLAENKADVIRGQGFVVAQDRLFQIEFYRALIKGELSSLVGTSMVDSDIKMRVLNLAGNAKKNYALLDAETKQFINWYISGFNEYLKVGKAEFPLELSLLDITPKPMTPDEIVAVTHFIGLFHSQNMNDEILSLNLAAHTDFAKELLPLNINLDRTQPLNFSIDTLDTNLSSKKELSWTEPVEPLLPYLKLGSNNWAIAGNKSKSGKPILSNDPHVDARMLPGNFYPIGLICPEFNSVGITAPGLPGLLVGRNEYVSFGVTNAYGDSQDLFIEEADGDFYMQNGQKVAFKKRKEIIQVKGGESVEIDIRSSQRGPIISDFAAFGIMTEDVVSLRWSLAEVQSQGIGFERMLETKNVGEFRGAIERMDNMFFNFVIADVEGSIAHQSTGLVPIRHQHHGAVPQFADQDSSWLGFIPKSELPYMINPGRGWVGTANHDTRPDAYPYYYSNHFSPFYRYKRLKEVMGQDKKWDANELWELIFDCKNMQAEQLTPLFVAALEQDEATQDLADILKVWNYEEEIESVGAAIYNVLYNEFLYLMLDDELPDEVEEMFWKSVYFWNQRVDDMITSNHPFIDNVKTSEKENLTDLVVSAGIKTKEFLTKEMGPNPKDWQWGKIHTVRFASPIRQKGIGSSLVGAETFPKSGSNQTLNRGGFVKNRNHKFDVGWFSSFRMIADMNDSEKVMGILSGGSAARIFHPYHKSQLDKWNTGEWIPYWFTKEKVMENAQHELILE